MYKTKPSLYYSCISKVIDYFLLLLSVIVKPYCKAIFLSISSFSFLYPLYLLLQELIDLNCLIPDANHIDEIIRTATSRMLNTSPNSFSISSIAKKEGCNIKYTESPIARGAKIKAEIETPSRVFLILVICSIKPSIRLSMFSRAAAVGEVEIISASSS